MTNPSPSKNTKECCEQCISPAMSGHRPPRPLKSERYCQDPACKCHTPHQSGWEEEFEERFTTDCSREKQPKIKCRHFKGVDDVNSVINFIHTTLAQEREELLEKLYDTHVTCIDGECCVGKTASLLRSII